MDEQVRFVKLLPLNPKKGFFRASHSVRVDGGFRRFNQPNVWIKVSVVLADILEKERQITGDPMSQPVFKVCDEKEARRIDAQEAAARKAALRSVEPSVDTALDMTEPGRGDLSLDEVTSGRKAALESATRRAEGLTANAEIDDSEDVSVSHTKKKGKKSSKRSRRK